MSTNTKNYHWKFFYKLFLSLDRFYDKSYTNLLTFGNVSKIHRHEKSSDFRKSSHLSLSLHQFSSWSWKKSKHSKTLYNTVFSWFFHEFLIIFYAKCKFILKGGLFRSFNSEFYETSKKPILCNIPFIIS